MAYFISATSGLMTEQLTTEESYQEFKKSIQNEPNHNLLPLLYSIYISRAGITNRLNSDVYKNISYPISYIDDKKINESVREILLSSFISYIKICQSNITTCNKYRLDPDFDIERLKQKSSFFFSEYMSMVKFIVKFIHGSFDSKNSDAFSKSLTQYNHLINEYINDIARLNTLNTETINTKIINTERDNQISSPKILDTKNDYILLIIVFLMAAFFVILKKIRK